jgi:hypothetical protein
MIVTAYKPRCGECGTRVGTSAFGRDHKFSCGLSWWPNARFPLAKRNPGLAIRNPDRARWPEVAHAKRAKQYRHPRSTDAHPAR